MIENSEIILRILIALLFGGVIGLERQYHDKPAGFATNTLICVGSAVFALLSVLSAYYLGGDPARIAAQIVAGVGFLGAGSILRDGNKISGLTTAAGIWLVAAVGMAVGYGQYFIGAVATASVLILQIFIRKLMTTFDYMQLYDSLTIKCSPKWQIVEKIKSVFKNNQAEIVKEEIHKENGLIVLKLVVNMSATKYQKIVKDLAPLEDIKSLDK
ncbi:MAG: MgtC/SapB family protein [Elusimicrobiaceae bacterium]|nr:MgtC/SapB family protein [Elusimicrobiaceae bacterium]